MFKINREGYYNCASCVYVGDSIPCQKAEHVCMEGSYGYFVNDEVEPPQSLETEDALSVQVGGGHYKDFKIQPVEFCQKNQLNCCETNIVKYACRHGAKGGAEDVRKIIHYAKLLLLLDYGEKE